MFAGVFVLSLVYYVVRGLHIYTVPVTLVRSCGRSHSGKNGLDSRGYSGLHQGSLPSTLGGYSLVCPPLAVSNLDVRI